MHMIKIRKSFSSYTKDGNITINRSITFSFNWAYPQRRSKPYNFVFLEKYTTPTAKKHVSEFITTPQPYYNTQNSQTKHHI